MFITLEGIDGAGKSTQARKLYTALQAQGYPVLLTREPGGTPIGDQIRAVVIENHDNAGITPQTELLLFCASRAQLVHEVIRPFVQKGGIVLCDRYADSTLAYQGYGLGLDLDTLRQILNFATGGLVPDKTLYFQLTPHIGLERRQRGRLLQSEEWNRLDDKALAFHERVYNGYQALINENPSRWLVVDAHPDVEAIHQAVLDTLLPFLPTLPNTHTERTLQTP